MASRREAALGEHAATYAGGRTEMRREQVGASMTNRDEESGRHQGSNAVAKRERGGREQHIQLTVIVLSPNLGVFCALHFFSLALLRSSSGSF